MRGFIQSCILLGTLALIAGCASFRSDIAGRYTGTAPSGQPSGQPSGKVGVTFLFTHVRQMKGYDVIPKLESPYRAAHNFDDLFADALRELSTVGIYETFTDQSSDVNDPARRARRASLISGTDFTVALRFSRETSFVKRTFGILGSTLSATLVPIPYSRSFTVNATVRDRSGRVVKEYNRSARVTTWVQPLLVTLYPFRPEQRKTEEVYVDFLHDIFREMEADRVLTLQAR